MEKEKKGRARILFIHPYNTPHDLPKYIKDFKLYIKSVLKDASFCTPIASYSIDAFAAVNRYSETEFRFNIEEFYIQRIIDFLKDFDALFIIEDGSSGTYTYKYEYTINIIKRAIKFPFMDIVAYTAKKNDLGNIILCGKIDSTIMRTNLYNSKAVYIEKCFDRLISLQKLHCNEDAIQETKKSSNIENTSITDNIESTMKIENTNITNNIESAISSNNIDFSCKKYPAVIDSAGYTIIQNRAYDYLCSKLKVGTSQLNDMFETIDRIMSNIDIGHEIYFYEKPYTVLSIFSKEKGIIKLGRHDGAADDKSSFIVKLTEMDSWKHVDFEKL